MLGRSTAWLESGARRWVQRLWGYADISTRQKWLIVWPELSGFSKDRLLVLDMGCGSGRWVMELAARRPGWQVTGLDRDDEVLKAAAVAAERLGLENASFVCSDFLSFAPRGRFDVVLSVLSAHYLVEAGEGLELFRRLESWLKPEGLLILLGPRWTREAPFLPWLPRQYWHEVFSRETLLQFCERSQLTVETLRGVIGPLGTAAKQIDFALDGRRRLRIVLFYPLQLALTLLDTRFSAGNRRRSLMWLLVARRPGPRLLTRSENAS